MDILDLLNKNPAILMALFSLIAFPMGLILLGFAVKRMGVGGLVKVMQDHVIAEVKIEGRLTEIVAELKNQSAANWDNRRYLDEQFDQVKEALKTILTSMPKRKEDL
jgi:Tfp pilus assembly protein PilO